MNRCNLLLYICRRNILPSSIYLRETDTFQHASAIEKLFYIANLNYSISYDVIIRTNNNVYKYLS